MNKKTVLIDLDGVLNTYNGEYSFHIIPPIRDGAVDFLKELYKNYKLILFSTRDTKSVKKWAAKHGLEKYFSDYTNKKQCAFLTIDDRCIQFDGNYSNTINAIEKFSVWWEGNRK